MKPAWIVYGLHGVLLLTQVLLLRDIGNSISPTVDAPHHFAIGLMTLGTGDVRYCHDDPPLQNYINALPVFLCYNPQLPVDSWAWKEAKHLYSIAREVLNANRDRYLEMFSTARWGTIFLAVLLSVLVFWWAKVRLGVVPALVTQTVLTFEPNLLGHGCLVTTDMGAVATFFAAAAAVDLFVREPSIRRLLLVGVVVGIAWLAKHAAIVLFPLFWILARSMNEVRTWVGPAGAEPENKSAWLSCEIRCLGLVFPLLAVALGVVWVGYGFEIGDSRSYLAAGDSRQVCDIAASTVLRLRALWPGEALSSEEETDVREQIGSFLRRYLPAFSHFEGILVQRAHARGGHPVFFRGRFGTSGWWDFYPTLFLVKSTLPFLVLVGVGAWAVFSRRAWGDVTRRFLWVSPLVYGVVLLATNRAQIGYRHAMPMLPFLLLWIGLAVRDVFNLLSQSCYPTPALPVNGEGECDRSVDGEGKQVGLGDSQINPLPNPPPILREGIIETSLVSWPIRITVLALLVFGHALSVWRVHPFELTYFNEPAGGPAAALMWAVDSNADWGQALPQLEAYIRNNGIERIKLIYFGVPELVDLYDIPYEQATVSHLHDPGYVAISLTALTGIPHQLSVRSLQPFWDSEPVARLGNAIYLYRLPDR